MLRVCKDWSLFTVHSFYSAFIIMYNRHLSLLVRLCHHKKSPWPLSNHLILLILPLGTYSYLSAFVDLQSQVNDLWHAFFTQHHILEVHPCMFCGAYDSLNPCSGGSAWPLQWLLGQWLPAKVMSNSFLINYCYCYLVLEMELSVRHVRKCSAIEPHPSPNTKS